MNRAILVASITVPALTGCIGQMGVTKIATGFNLKAVDNRYGRAGLYLLMAPVYAITSAIDLMVVNSIEFWTGTNPVTGKAPAVADTPVEAYLKVNTDLGEDLSEAPLSSINNPNEKTFHMRALDDNGFMRIIEGKRTGDKIDIYIDGEYAASTSLEEMKRFAEENHERLALAHKQSKMG
ncbi:hypothetical protein A3742_32115 [Oleiphilus sp. HI0071]|nr:hypothetical protein A3737_04380 [Oleiphilus sp. HI0065]KZY81690.1 hypothetical protein A3742_11145 [Oleiphilus sp. HI0071]KZZ00783.1 hypothetical protein A3744_28955 [Oleiphilus sp. HI0073]KZZ17027.1 hypothetical protein A3751_12900 [Oleiphilus sp. HI0080]KZZ48215.1 hypothetical protein A3760_04090 [Oleiphilus sp. HI0122]